jgi:hypothetical protein
MNILFTLVLGILNDNGSTISPVNFKNLATSHSFTSQVNFGKIATPFAGTDEL